MRSSSVAVVAVLFLTNAGSITSVTLPEPASSPEGACPTTITQSTSQTIVAGNSVLCTDGPPYSHFSTSYWRAFHMAAFTNLRRYDITSVSFGVQFAQSGSGTGQPVTVRLYANNGAPFPGGNRVQLAAVAVTVADGNGMVRSVPLSASVPAGTSELVMEVFAPDGHADGNSLIIGSNPATETGPSYVSAVACGSPTPVTTAEIGFPDMHLVFNVRGSCPSQASTSATNISTRLRVELGDNAMIAGFILTGSQTKQVVLRGIGPSLVNSGISDVLLNPVLALYTSAGSLYWLNDDWRDSQEAELQATSLQPSDDHESAMVHTLSPAAYTSILSGSGQSTGIGLLEIYGINSSSDSRLANLSTRGLVQTAGNVMIGGFILEGTQNADVAIRGLGPSLAQAGISNVLVDPIIELHDGNGTTLIANDNWQDNPTSAAALAAHGLAPSNGLESGLFINLPPGQFTAILAGKNGGTGIGLVELYTIQ